ncbi:MAG: HesA/MoeB/ThiF family protein [Coriobacteriales bacterium]
MPSHANDPRYSRNKSLISAEDQERLAEKHVLVVGCGGIGGYVIESLARLGVGKITAVDGDRFDETNLNRQLFSSNETLGMPKAQAAMERLSIVNPNVEVTPVFERFGSENASWLLEGVDAVADALDNAESRGVLLRAAAEVGIPAVHASIAGWSIRVAVCMPEDEAIRAIASYGGVGLEKELGNPPFTAATAGSIEAAQIAKILLGSEGVEPGTLLEYDLLRNTLHKIEVQARRNTATQHTVIR